MTSSTNWSVDRIENGIAVLVSDQDQVKELPVSELPADIKESDRLACTDNGWQVDREDTENRLQKNRDLLAKLLNKN